MGNENNQGVNYKKLANFALSNFVVIAFIVIFIASCFLSPAFLTKGNLMSVLIQNSIYAICAVAGSAAYWLGVTGVGLSKGVCVIASVVITVALRRLSLRFNVKTPADVDLTPGVAETLRRAAEGAAKHNEDRK